MTKLNLLSLNKLSVNKTNLKSLRYKWTTTKAIVNKELESIKSSGTWKVERVITSKQDSHIYVEGKSDKVINFCANNYLGLSVSSVI